jgi:hypothetical protein
MQSALKPGPLPAIRAFLSMALPRLQPLRRGFFHVGLIQSAPSG